MSRYLSFLLLFLPLFVHAQLEGREGSYFVFWEYNRSDYLTSIFDLKGLIRICGMSIPHAKRVIMQNK